MTTEPCPYVHTDGMKCVRSLPHPDGVHWVPMPPKDVVGRVPRSIRERPVSSLMTMDKDGKVSEVPLYGASGASEPDPTPMRQVARENAETYKTEARAAIAGSTMTMKGTADQLLQLAQIEATLAVADALHQIHTLLLSRRP